MVGDKAVGVYSAAVRVSEVWYFIPTTIVASVFPAILKARNSSEEQYYKKLQHLFDLMLWLSIGIALPMTFLSESVIKILFGETYLDASSILSIHIWASVFVFFAENRQILSFQRTTIGALANVILNFLFIPQFQAVGAATATIISYAIATIISDLFQAETRFIFFMKIESFNLLKVIYRIRILKNSL
jgi:PST family polysaccharide transporter